jgi:hypothetical protein
MVGRPLVAVGGFAVDAEALAELERGLDEICARWNFPKGCEFKWSPPSDNWMAKNLVDGERRGFFLEVLALAKMRSVRAWVVVEDTCCKPAEAKSHEADVLELFLERFSKFLSREGSTGFVISDQPGGGKASENKFLLDCLEMRRRGSTYVPHDRLALSIVCAKSEFVRCLQLADLITSCTTSRVGGERRHAPLVFEGIRPLLDCGKIGCGGTGLKIHPDFLYRNLYHWIAGDDSYGRGWQSQSLPCGGALYQNSEWE